MKFFPPKSLELTVALIKPHAAVVPTFVERIRERIIKNDFLIVRWKTEPISKEAAEIMYGEHKGKPFYSKLVSMMTSGPVGSFLLAREDAIRKWRTLMGPTRALEAQYAAPITTRGTFGISNTRNATHGSDSPESAKKEAGVFFPEFDFDCWYFKEEVYYRNGYVKYDEIELVHKKEDCDAPSIILYD